MAKEKSSYQKVAQIDSNKRVSIQEIVKRSPQLAAVGSKIVKSSNEKNAKHQTLYNLSKTGDGGIFDSTVTPKLTRYQNNRNMLELFPDLELAMQILVSSILSPKDMVSSELIYRLKDTLLPNEITSQLMDQIRLRLDTEYGIKAELSTILNDSLFLKGAHIKAVLPESAVDYLINIQHYQTKDKQISIESIRKELKIKDDDFENIGILGPYQADPKKRFSLERRFTSNPETVEKHLCIESENGVEVVDNNITITDNYNILRMPLIQRKLRKKLLYKKKSTSAATESSETIKLSKSPQRDYVRAMQVPDKENLPRKSVGKPLVINIPSIATIPVFAPGSPKDHLGYFVLLDENGYPVSYTDKDTSIPNGANISDVANTDLGSHLLSRARNNLLGRDNKDRLSTDVIMAIYSDIVEENLKRRLANGLYDTSVTISNSEEIYRLMLARSLENRQTRILYIPAEYVTYFAFDYYDNGVGKSILDKLSVISSIRAVLMFSRVMAQVKSAINLTEVNIEIDPEDPDPQKTIEIISAEVMKLRQTYFPLGITSANDLVNWIQRAGLEFTFEGHPGLPSTKINFDSKNLQHQVPEGDFEEELRKQSYMTMGLSPETVDNGFSSEFATTVVANNILLSKRIQVYQDIFTDKLTDFCQKLLMMDEEFQSIFNDTIADRIDDVERYLSDEDKELLKEHGKEVLIDHLYEEFIEYFEVVLPKPDETSIDVQLEAFNKYQEALDAVLNYWVSENLVTSEVSGEVSTYIEMIKETIKAYYIRQWMANNNFMTELNDLVTQDEDGRPNLDLLEVSSGHLEALMKSISEFVKNISSVKKETDKAIEETSSEGSESDSEEF